MARLWGILRKKQKMLKDFVVEVETTDEEGTHAAIDRLCYLMDIPRPLFLRKHENELEQFGRTQFTPDHFIEEVHFDRFEIEFLHEKSRSADPRNDFGAGV